MYNGTVNMMLLSTDELVIDLYRYSLIDKPYISKSQQLVNNSSPCWIHKTRLIRNLAVLSEFHRIFKNNFFEEVFLSITLIS